jgi:hypothetical protein
VPYGHLHSFGQSGGDGGLGRQGHERAHGGDLVAVLLHPPVERSAVFRTDQSLRRTGTLGRVRQVEPVSVDHVVKVATALFVNTKAVNPLDGIMNERL